MRGSGGAWTVPCGAQTAALQAGRGPAGHPGQRGGRLGEAVGVLQVWGRGHGTRVALSLPWAWEGGGGAQGAQGAVRQETRTWDLEVQVVLQLEHGGRQRPARDTFAAVSGGLGALRVSCPASLRPVCPGTWPSSVVWALHPQLGAAGDRGPHSRP